MRQMSNKLVRSLEEDWRMENSSPAVVRFIRRNVCGRRERNCRRTSDVDTSCKVSHELVDNVRGGAGREKVPGK